MDLKRLPQACDPVQLNENLFAAADQLEASRHSRPARRMVEKFTEFELCLATAALGVAAVAREVFVAIAGSSLVLVKLGLHVTRALTKSRVCEKAYKQLPGKQSCIHQTKRIFGQTLGIGTSLIGAALFWCKGVKWDISAQKRLGNYHPDKPVTKPKPAIQLKPNVLNHQLEEPVPNLLQQPGEPPADAVQIASQGAAPGSLPQGVPQQMQAIIPKAPPTPKGKVPARKQPVPPARGKAAAQAISQPVPTPPPRAQGPAQASPQPVPTPPPRAQVNVAPPPPPRAQVPAPATSPVVTPPPAQGSVPPPPPRTQADGAQQQAPANPPVGPAVVPPRPPPPPPPSRLFSPPRDPRNQPSSTPAPAVQQPPTPAATSALDSITSPRAKRLSAQLAEQKGNLNLGIAAQVEAERKAEEDARKDALKKGTMRTNTKNNISAILQGTAPKPAAAPSRPVPDPVLDYSKGGFILDFQQNIYDFETGIGNYEVNICKDDEEIGQDIIRMVDYIHKHLRSPQPGQKIAIKGGGELVIAEPKDGFPRVLVKHPFFTNPV